MTIKAYISLALLTAALAASYFVGGRVERSSWLEKDKTRLETEVSDLVEQRKEITRLVALTKERQDDYLKALVLIDELKRRPLAGLREQELKAALARADADRLRTYGFGATAVARACIKEYRDLGVEAGGAAAVAQARRPTTPTPPTQVRR